jgi:hypothetical protein
LLEVVAVVVAAAGLITALARSDVQLGHVVDRLAAENRAVVSGEDLVLEPVGGPWPDGEIRYYSAAPEHAWALDQAVRAWNGSGAHVRFTAVSEDDASVVISSQPDQKCGHGRGTLGYSPRSTVVLFAPGAGQGCDAFSAARVLTHELGHVLGLEHDDSRCAAMNSAGSYRGSERCTPSRPWEWRCRLLEVTDVLRAARLYGGSPVRVGPATCALPRSLG